MNRKRVEVSDAGVGPAAVTVTSPKARSTATGFPSKANTGPPKMGAMPIVLRPPARARKLARIRETSAPALTRPKGPPKEL
jgi:hypothetical protein